MLFVLFSEYMEKLEQCMDQLLSQVLCLSRGRKERGGEIEPLSGSSVPLRQDVDALITLHL